MAKTVITARIEPELDAQIAHLVTNGVFPTTSSAVGTLLQIGLLYCQGHDLDDITTVSLEFQERASIIARELAVKSLVQSVTHELANLIELGQERPIIDALARIKKVASNLSPETQEQFWKQLQGPVYNLAQQMVR